MQPLMHHIRHRSERRHELFRIPPMLKREPRVSAYENLRVVDFTQGVAGPMAAMLLGDLGAEIVKIEPPEGDPLQTQPAYLALNRNKQVLTLDLATASGEETARALIAGADVAIFDAGPTRMAASGFNREWLAETCPMLISAWMPPYGTEGPWSDLPPHHNLLAGLAGGAWRQGAISDQPVHLIGPAGWYGQGVMGTVAIGAALLERNRSGLGQHVTISGLHGFALTAGPSRILSLPPMTRSVPLGANPRYRLYRCADGKFFFLGALFDNFYARLFEALGYADLFPVLVVDMEGARNFLDTVFETRPVDEWLALLQAHGVPCAQVGPRDAWFETSLIGEAGLRLSFTHEELGEVTMPAPAVNMSGTPARVKSLPQPIATAPPWPQRSAGKAAADRLAPLAGVRILNFGTVLAGAYPGAILSSLGADVIKIEPAEGDPFRYDPTFLGFNRGTRSLGLDLKHPEGRATFLRLVEQADVVIDNYRTGVRARLGIDYPVLKALNPRIISCSISAYGHIGERVGRPGFDPLLQAESGMMAAQGGGGDPQLLTTAVSDVAAAGMLSAHIIAALDARERSGEGQEILTSLMAQSLLFQLGEIVTHYGRPATDIGGTDCIGLTALHRYYACLDGWIGIACDTAAEAEALTRMLGVDTGGPDAALAAPREGMVAEALAAAFADRNRADVLDALLRANVPATPAIRADEVFRDDWLWRNGYLERWEHPVRESVIGVRGYADFSATPGGFVHPAPELAQHSRHILAEYGLTDEAIDGLIASGAVFDRPLRAR
jgi:crotonobetainyl-CoA:carnitine CoA-transferase CaiB-like acyl-CoA transferase